MERQELENVIIECVSTSYNKEASTLSLETRFAEDLGGASILMVGLVSQIENELDVLVELPVASACKTIGELVDKVETMV